MHVPSTCNRACIQLPRPLFHYFLFTTIFPSTDSNADFPGAAALNTIIKNLWLQYYILHNAGKTALADQKYVQILDATVNLMLYIESVCIDNDALLETSGFTANKRTHTAEPQTAVPIELHSMVQGHGKFKVEYVCDRYMHSCMGRTRLKGSPETDWRILESSETKTMLFEEFTRASEIEVQIKARGTKGESDWSDSIFVVID